MLKLLLAPTLIALSYAQRLGQMVLPTLSEQESYRLDLHVAIRDFKRRASAEAEARNEGFEEELSQLLATLIKDALYKCDTEGMTLIELHIHITDRSMYESLSVKLELLQELIREQVSVSLEQVPRAFVIDAGATLIAHIECNVTLEARHIDPLAT